MPRRKDRCVFYYMWDTFLDKRVGRLYDSKKKIKIALDYKYQRYSKYKSLQTFIREYLNGNDKNGFEIFKWKQERKMYERIEIRRGIAVYAEKLTKEHVDHMKFEGLKRPDLTAYNKRRARRRRMENGGR